ncbi:hypothetical protein AHF37_04085, partial [Paragonimus kellicotti]
MFPVSFSNLASNASEIAVAPTVDLPSLFSDCHPSVGSVHRRTTGLCRSSAPQLRSTKCSVQANCPERKLWALPVDRTQVAGDLPGATSDEACLKGLSNSSSATNITGNFELGREISEDWTSHPQFVTRMLLVVELVRQKGFILLVLPFVLEIVHPMETVTSPFTCATFTELVDTALQSNSTRSMEVTDQVSVGLQSENQNVISVVTPEGPSACSE